MVKGKGNRRSRPVDATTHALGEGLTLTRRPPPSAASESALEGGRSALARAAPTAARGFGGGAPARLAMVCKGGKDGQRHHPRMHARTQLYRQAGQPARGKHVPMEGKGVRGLVGTAGRKAQTAVATTTTRRSSTRRKGGTRIGVGAVSAGTKEVDR